MRPKFTASLCAGPASRDPGSAVLISRCRGALFRIQDPAVIPSSRCCSTCHVLHVLRCVVCLGCLFLWQELGFRYLVSNFTYGGITAARVPLRHKGH